MTDILKYHATTSFAWSQVSGGGGGIMNDVIDDTTPQLGGTLDANGSNIDMGNNIITDTKVGYWDPAYSIVPSGGTIGGNPTVTGNFVVNGTTTTINTQDLLVSDNIITLNSDVTGTPFKMLVWLLNAEQVPNVDIRWNEIK